MSHVVKHFLRTKDAYPRKKTYPNLKEYLHIFANNDIIIFMDKKEIFRMHADFCKFMGHPKRIEILFLLGKKEMRVEDIAGKMKIKIPNVSQHLAIMRQRNVLEIRRDGVKIYYRIANQEILEACVIMRDLMIAQLKNKMNIIRKI